MQVTLLKVRLQDPAVSSIIIRSLTNGLWTAFRNMDEIERNFKDFVASKTILLSLRPNIKIKKFLNSILNSYLEGGIF